MINRFREFPDLIHKVERRLEIFEFVLLLKMAPINDFPAISKLLVKSLQFRALERLNTSAAGRVQISVT